MRIHAVVHLETHNGALVGRAVSILPGWEVEISLLSETQLHDVLDHIAGFLAAEALPLARATLHGKLVLVTMSPSAFEILRRLLL